MLQVMGVQGPPGAWGWAVNSRADRPVMIDDIDDIDDR